MFDLWFNITTNNFPVISELDLWNPYCLKANVRNFKENLTLYMKSPAVILYDMRNSSCLSVTLTGIVDISNYILVLYLSSR